MHCPQPNQQQSRDAGFDYPVTLPPDGATLMATFVKCDEAPGQW